MKTISVAVSTFIYSAICHHSMECLTYDLTFSLLIPNYDYHYSPPFYLHNKTVLHSNFFLKVTYDMAYLIA